MCQEVGEEPSRLNSGLDTLVLMHSNVQTYVDQIARENALQCSCPPPSAPTAPYLVGREIPAPGWRNLWPHLERAFSDCQTTQDIPLQHSTNEVLMGVNEFSPILRDRRLRQSGVSQNHANANTGV